VPLCEMRWQAAAAARRQRKSNPLLLLSSSCYIRYPAPSSFTGLPLSARLDNEARSVHVPVKQGEAGRGEVGAAG